MANRKNNSQPRTIATRSMAHVANEEEPPIADPGVPPRVVHSPIMPIPPANVDDELDDELSQSHQVIQESLIPPYHLQAMHLTRLIFSPLIM